MPRPSAAWFLFRRARRRRLIDAGAQCRLVHRRRHSHINTTIVDLDLPFGTVGLNFNEEPSQGVADALTAPERLDDVLLERLLYQIEASICRCSLHPPFWSAASTPNPQAYEAVLDAVRRMTPCVIVDLPRHLDTLGTSQTILAADDIVIVDHAGLAKPAQCEEPYVDLLG